MASINKPKLPVGGLATGPNDLDMPAGNFLVAENVVHRRTGILEPMKGDENVTPEWVDQPRAVRIFADWEPQYSLRIVKPEGDDYGVLQYGDTPTQWTGTTFRPGETQCVYADRRHILSGGEFVTVVENTGDNTHNAPRRAGQTPPHYLFLTQGTAASDPDRLLTLPANKVCAYTAVIKRKVVGDRFIVSAPAPKVSPIVDASFAQFIDVVVNFQAAADGQQLVRPGDIVQLYRTVAFDSAGELNDTYYLAAEHVLKGLEVSAEAVNIADRTPDEALGEELYTNPGVEGSLKLNMPLPQCSGVETYNQTTFYINRRTAPAATFAIPGSFGLLPAVTTPDTQTQRVNGIGKRVVTGTLTLGSPTITSISADDLLGLAEGQIVASPYFAGGSATVTAVGASTITVDKSATFTTTYAFSVHDAMRVVVTKDGVSQTSDWFNLTGADALIADLLFLEAGGSPVPGLAAMVDRVYTPAPTSTLDGATIQIVATLADLYDSFAIQVTNPQNYSGAFVDGALSWYREISSLVDERKNILWYSKPNLPESVAPVQFIPVGVGTCYRLLNVQSSLLAFCSDGVFKIEGEGDNWFISPVDKEARIVHPDCAIANATTAFAWLESGLALVTETGTQNIGRDAIGPGLTEAFRVLRADSDTPKYEWGPQMTIDRPNNEVWLNIIRDTEFTPLLACYVLNTQTGKFTTVGDYYTAVGYSPKFTCVLRAKPDGFLYADTSLESDYKPATVVYSPVVNNAGEVKQWLDVNYFFDDVPNGSVDVIYEVEALFGGELTSTTNVFERRANGAPRNLFALHSLVPRRAARDVELVFGFKTTTTVSESNPSGGYYFQFKGASVRVRRTGMVIKR